MSTLPTKPASPATDPAKRVLPPNPRAAALLALGFTAVLYLIELLDQILPADLDQGGIHSRTLAGLDGVLFAPLLHTGWSHLFANTLPVLILGFLAMAAGVGRWAIATTIIWLVSGLGVWLTGPSGVVTVGASGLAFGWLAFLLARGIFTRSAGQLAVAVALLGVWSGMLAGLIPGQPGISWQGHVFGALAGVLAAWLVTRADKARKAGPGAPGSLGE